MEESGRGELANKVISGLDSPEKATLIVRPMVSGVIDVVERLAELKLDDPAEQFSVVECGPHMDEESLLGSPGPDPVTGNRIPGRIDEKTEICFLDSFDCLNPVVQAKIVKAIPEHKAVFYLAINSLEPNDLGCGVPAPLLECVDIYRHNWGTRQESKALYAQAQARHEARAARAEMDATHQ